MISIRTNITQEVLKVLENRYITKEKLNPVKEVFLKPKGISLKDFHPNNKILKMGISGRNAVLTLVLFKDNSNIEYNLYSENEDKVLKLIEELGFEIWGKLESQPIRYKLRGADVFLENFNEIGGFLRIESENQVSLDNNIGLLNAENIIKKNSAVLLAEKLGLV